MLQLVGLFRLLLVVVELCDALSMKIDPENTTIGYLMDSDVQNYLILINAVAYQHVTQRVTRNSPFLAFPAVLAHVFESTLPRYTLEVSKPQLAVYVLFLESRRLSCMYFSNGHALKLEPS